MELISVNDIYRNEDNPRTITDEKLKGLIESIKKFPKMLELRPIVINKDNVVLGGNMRLKACIGAGLKEVPVLRADDLTEEQQKEFIIKDNVSGGAWDWEILANEWDLKELDEWGLDIPDMVNADAEETTGEDEAPEVPVNPETVEGDLWELGEHRLLCGDSTSPADVELLMNGCCPDLIQTDPPYGMNAVTKSGVLSANYQTDILGDDNPDIAKDAFSLIYNLYPNSKHIWWGANYYCSVLPDSECWLVWDKNNGESDQTDCELAWANFRSVVRQFTQASEKTNRVHPTQKPVSLVEWIYRRFKLSSNTIADFFGGSGVTLISAEKNGKKSYTMEHDPKFADVIVKRYINFCCENNREFAVKLNGENYKGELLDG